MLDNSVGKMAKEEAVKAAYFKTDKEFLGQVFSKHKFLEWMINMSDVTQYVWCHVIC